MQSHIWIRSSRSVNGGTCVELTTTLDALRDSKDPNGPVLRADVRSFVRAVKTGRFDR